MTNQIDELMALADSYAHVYAFVGDDAMPRRSHGGQTMNDTVMKLMSMVDLLCSACVDDVCAGDQAIPNYESNASTLHADLEAELTRLFTPLTDEQIKRQTEVFVWLDDPDDFRSGVKWAEEHHGITGESNEPT
jgi:hypothetical protein